MGQTADHGGGRRGAAHVCGVSSRPVAECGRAAAGPRSGTDRAARGVGSDAGPARDDSRHRGGSAHRATSWALQTPDWAAVDDRISPIRGSLSSPDRLEPRFGAVYGASDVYKLRVNVLGWNCLHTSERPIRTAPLDREHLPRDAQEYESRCASWMAPGPLPAAGVPEAGICQWNIHLRDHGVCAIIERTPSVKVPTQQDHIWNCGDNRRKSRSRCLGRRLGGTAATYGSDFRPGRMAVRRAGVRGSAAQLASQRRFPRREAYHAGAGVPQGAGALCIVRRLGRTRLAPAGMRWKVLARRPREGGIEH